MARVLALTPDLLFGSRVQAELSAAGHQVDLVSKAEDARERLSGADVLIIDLTDERVEGAELVEGLKTAPIARASSRPRTLGFYSHVDVAIRRRAEEAGFDLVVPRSRMAREGAAIVDRLAVLPLGD